MIAEFKAGVGVRVDSGFMVSGKLTKISFEIENFLQIFPVLWVPPKWNHEILFRDSLFCLRFDKILSDLF